MCIYKKNQLFQLSSYFKHTENRSCRLSFYLFWDLWLLNSCSLLLRQGPGFLLPAMGTGMGSGCVSDTAKLTNWSQNGWRGLLGLILMRIFKAVILLMWVFGFFYFILGVFSLAAIWVIKCLTSLLCFPNTTESVQLTNSKNKHEWKPTPFSLPSFNHIPPWAGSALCPAEFPFPPSPMKSKQWWRCISMAHRAHFEIQVTAHRIYFFSDLSCSSEAAFKWHQWQLLNNPNYNGQIPFW